MAFLAASIRELRTVIGCIFILWVTENRFAASLLCRSYFLLFHWLRFLFWL
jgi:hypothetical protein